MGYHVTILRTEGGQALPIATDEVRAALAKMGGLLAPQADVDEFRLVFPELGDESEIIICEDDELWASNPSDQLLEAMITLAGHLGARVRGDELETYRSLDDWYAHPDDQALHQEIAARQASWGRKSARRQNIARTIKCGLLGTLVIVAIWRWLNGGA